MKVIIIGGGIIGLSAAYYLNRDGWEVTVVDRTDLSDSCSYGNLGMIVPSHFVPLAAPGIVSQGIRWMFNSKSPFYVRPSLSVPLLSWGLHFLRSATNANVDKAAPHLRDINLLSKQLYLQLQDEPGMDFSLQQKGILMYFRKPEVADEEGHLAERARGMGLDVSILDRKAAQAMEPQVEMDVLGAVHYRCDAHLSPDLLNRQLINLLRDRGVNFLLQQPVTSIETANGKVSGVQVGDQLHSADLFVMAAGSWLPQLMKKAGSSLSLMAGKGYSFTLESPAVKLNTPAILCEARVAITPMDNRMRYGGTMELGAIDDKVNLKRVQGIVESVPAYFPGIGLQMPEKEDVWFGYRPCSPDGIPYIGYSRRLSNTIIAGGHAMMGLSLGPATGKLVAELAKGEKTSVSVSAFDPNRFGMV